MAPLATAAQVNLLIYHYLKESGFAHACFSLRHEARLDDAPGANEAVIEPGALVRFLQKGLLYAAVEAHVREDGTEAPCSAPFRLVGPPHVCDGRPRPAVVAAPSRLTPSPPPEEPQRRRDTAAQTTAALQQPHPRSRSVSVAPAGTPAPRPNGAADRSSKEASSSKARLGAPAAAAEEEAPPPSSSSGAASSGKRKAGATSGREEKRAKREGGEEVNGRADDAADEDEEEDDAGPRSVSRNGKAAATGKKSSTPAPAASLAAGTSKKKKKGATNGSTKDAAKEAAASSKPSAKEKAMRSVPALSVKAKGKEVAERSIRRLTGHNGEVFITSWNPSVPGLLASGAGDATVRIWDLSIGPDAASTSDAAADLKPTVCKHLPATQAKDVSALDWNPDGTLLASGSYDGILRLWTPQGDLHLVMSMHQGPIFAVRWNRKGNLLLTGSADGTAIVWDLGSGKVRQQFSTHSDSVLDLDWLCGARWSPAAIGAAPGATPSAQADSTLATCSADNSVNLLRLGEARPVRTLRGHTDEVNAIRFDSTGTLLASASDDMTCRIWSLDAILGPGFAGAGGTYATSALPGSLSEAQTSSDAADADAAERGAGASSAAMTRHVLRGHTKELYAVAWAPYVQSSAAPRLLATTSFDRTARLWNAEDGSCVRTFAEHTDSVYSLCFSPDARFMATGGIDQRVFVQRVSDGTIVKAYAGGGGVMDVTWYSEPARPSSTSSSGAGHKRSISEAVSSSSGASAANGHVRARSSDADVDAAAGQARSHRLAVAQSDRTLVVLDLSDIIAESGE